ncbi:MAG: YbaN family protein [Rhodothermus sp.]|nr:YbaN family protein [Rhodothermus sp.]
MRLLRLGSGLLCTALGFLGIVLPVLPATPFFLLATYLFARSSPRLEQWLLDLPRIGPSIRAYQAGLGIPRRTKWWATLIIVLSILLSVWRLPALSAKVLVIALGAIGLWYVHRRIPTREDVLARRSPDKLT